MTRKLEELFNLPQNEDDSVDEPAITEPALPAIPETLQALDKIEQALPAVRGLEASDEEMDELAKKASESFDDLMDLGMNVDSRYASEIFAVAGTMLGHAITAKTAKMNKKLKMIQLQLQKAKLDQSAGGDEESESGAVQTGTGHILDRNELLAQLVKREAKKPE